MTKIKIIGAFFGMQPIWFPAFYLSCARNEAIEWLFFTDGEIPKISYPNISFQHMDLEGLNALASNKLGLPIQKGVYSQLDLRPSYGEIFSEYIEGADFWGHCDNDVVWGDIRHFITEEILRNHDIVTCRKDFLAGHFTLWRNESKINRLFRSVPSCKELLTSGEYHWFDEVVMSIFLKSQGTLSKDGSKIDVYWPKQLVVGLHELNANPEGWYWENGKIFDAEHGEHVYIHFQNWKNSLNHIDFRVEDQPERFEISRQGFCSQPHANCKSLSWRSGRYGMGSFRRSLHLTRMRLLVKDATWARYLSTNKISPDEVHYERESQRLYLKRLNISIAKPDHLYLLRGYNWALQLSKRRNARFYIDENDEVFIDVEGITTSIHRADEILVLKQLFVDGIFNMLFSSPTVVWDTGMNVGSASLYFANQPEVVVFACEPVKKKYEQALRNIALNPALSEKIRTVNVGVSDASFQTIALCKQEAASEHGRPETGANEGGVLNFENREIAVEDADVILDSISASYPEHDVVLKLDFTGLECRVNGISEHHIVNRLRTTGKLDLVDAIMLKWNQQRFNNSPSAIADQLSNSGFRVLLLDQNDDQCGMLYAVRSETGDDPVKVKADDIEYITAR